MWGSSLTLIRTGPGSLSQSHRVSLVIIRRTFGFPVIFFTSFMNPAYVQAVRDLLGSELAGLFWKSGHESILSRRNCQLVGLPCDLKQGLASSVVSRSVNQQFFQ